MKRIAIISLIAVFLTANFAYANLSLEQLAEQIENTQYQEMTQEEAEALFITILDTMATNLSDESIEPCDLCSSLIEMFIIAVLGIPIGGFYFPVAILVMYLLFCWTGMKEKI